MSRQIGDSLFGPLGTAVIEGDYRYILRRTFTGAGNGVALFVMLNPSTADADLDDPTIRRCIRFARDWGYAELQVANIFAYRATDPRVLLTVADPIGPRNDEFILAAAKSANGVYAAWGVNATPARSQAVLALLASAGVRVQCLGETRDGFPKHPLYVAAHTRPVDYPATPHEATLV